MAHCEGTVAHLLLFSGLSLTFGLAVCETTSKPFTNQLCKTQTEAFIEICGTVVVFLMTEVQGVCVCVRKRENLNVCD